MSRRITIVSVWVIALIALAVVPALAAPALAGPQGRISGWVNGVLDQSEFAEQYGNAAAGEFECHYGITEVGPDGAAKGFAHFMARTADPSAPWVELYVAVDWVKFITVSGQPAAIYSGTVVKSTMYDWYTKQVCDWVGKRKFGMVIDGGTGSHGDQVVCWMTICGAYSRDVAAPLGSEIPGGAVDRRFALTGGDLVIQTE